MKTSYILKQFFLKLFIILNRGSTRCKRTVKNLNVKIISYDFKASVQMSQPSWKKFNIFLSFWSPEDVHINLKNRCTFFFVTENRCTYLVKLEETTQLVHQNTET